jgi:hypothetical protein
MKDNWTKAFQDKLGDYELEMPAAAPRRRGPGRLVLLLSGAAAAAALAAVLLLRTPDDGKQQWLPEGLIAEVPAAVVETQPDLPAAIRPMRSLAAENPQSQPQPQPTAAPEEERLEEPIVTEPVQPEEPEPQSVQPEEPVEPVEPAKAGVPETEETVIDWNDEEPTRRRAGISARLHVNPVGLPAEASDASPQPQSDGIKSPYGPFSTANSIGESYHTGLYVNNLDYNSTAKRDVGQSQTRCFLPVKTGVLVRIGGAGRLSLESGLNYSFHRATATASYGLVPIDPPYQIDYRMHYIGIPVKGVISIAEWRRLSLYAAAGGEMEWMAFGRMLLRASGQTLVDDRLQEHPFLFSLTGAGGLEFNFTPTLGLYAEPGIAWHATPKGNLPNYYRDHPLSFDLHLGLRFNL